MRTVPPPTEQASTPPPVTPTMPTTTPPLLPAGTPDAYISVSHPPPPALSPRSSPHYLCLLHHPQYLSRTNQSLKFPSQQLNPKLLFLEHLLQHKVHFLLFFMNLTLKEELLPNLFLGLLLSAGGLLAKLPLSPIPSLGYMVRQV